MDKIDDYIKKKIGEMPTIADDELERYLHDVKDPLRPKKSKWKIGYIRQKIAEYRRSQQPITDSASAPIESDKQKMNIEGVEVKKHPDIFEPRNEYSISPVTKKEKKIIEEPKKEIKQLSDEIETIKDSIHDLIGIVVDLKSNVNDFESSISKDLVSVKQSLASGQIISIVPEYEDIELRKPTIAAIKAACEEQNIDEESDYINRLMILEKDYEEQTDSIIKPFKSLVSVVKNAGGQTILQLSIDEASGRLAYLPIQGRGITKKGLIFGIIIGIIIGVCVTTSAFALLSFI